MPRGTIWPLKYDKVPRMSVSVANEHFLDTAQDLLHKVECGDKYDELAANMQWSASKVRHYVRIAKRLCPEVEELCYQNAVLTVGHAKLLASHSPGVQISLARNVLAKGWSVHQLHRHVKGESEKPASSYYQQLSESLSAQLGHPLVVSPNSGNERSGSITFKYHTLDDFDALCDRLGLDPTERF